MEYSALASQCFLFGTSLYGLRRIPDKYKYAKAVYRLHLYTGFFGVLHYGAKKASEEVLPLFQVSWTWAYCLGLPLVTVEMLGNTGFPFDLGPLELVIPLYCLLEYHVKDPAINFDLLRTAHFVNLLSLSLTWFYLERPMTFVIGSLFAFCVFCLGPEEIGDETGRMTLWAGTVSVLNLICLAFFPKSGYFSEGESSTSSS